MDTKLNTKIKSWEWSLRKPRHILKANIKSNLRQIEYKGNHYHVSVSPEALEFCSHPMNFSREIRKNITLQY